MSKSMPPGRGSIPPASAEYISVYLNERERSPSRPVFTKHRELAPLLASDSAEIFIISISHAIKRNSPSSDLGKKKHVLRELKSRMPRYLDYIFAELAMPTKEHLRTLSKKLTRSSAQILLEDKSPCASNLAETIKFARSSAKNAEGRGCTPAQSALAVAGTFAACAKLFSFQKKWEERNFSVLSAKISSQMSADTLLSFLWKVADVKTSHELAELLAELMRCGDNEKRITAVLTS